MIDLFEENVKTLLVNGIVLVLVRDFVGDLQYFGCLLGHALYGNFSGMYPLVLSSS